MNSNYSFPQLPSPHDERWRAALVCEGLRKKTELRRVPTTVLNTPELLIYSGSLIAIMNEVRHEEWVAALVSQKVGWLNTRDVDLIGTSDEESKLISQLDTLVVPANDSPLRQTVEAPAASSRLDEVPTKPFKPDALADALREVQLVTQTADLKAVDADSIRELTAALNRVADAMSVLTRIADALEALNKDSAPRS